MPTIERWISYLQELQEGGIEKVEYSVDELLMDFTRMHAEVDQRPCLARWVN